MSNLSWFAGECKECGYNVVVTQPSLESGMDYWYYCSNKNCLNHSPAAAPSVGEEIGDMEHPDWVRLNGDICIKYDMTKKQKELIKSLLSDALILKKEALARQQQYNDNLAYERILLKQINFILETYKKFEKL